MPKRMTTPNNLTHVARFIAFHHRDDRFVTNFTHVTLKPAQIFCPVLYQLENCLIKHLNAQDESRGYLDPPTFSLSARKKII